MNYACRGNIMHPCWRAVRLCVLIGLQLAHARGRAMLSKFKVILIGAYVACAASASSLPGDVASWRRPLPTSNHVKPAHFYFCAGFFVR